MDQIAPNHGNVLPTSRRVGDLEPWQRRIWIGVACALGLTVLAIIALVAWIHGNAWQMFASQIEYDHNFSHSGSMIVISSLLRLVAILIGACVAFGGLVVSFYSQAHTTKIEGNGGGFKGGLSTNSPGITAIVVGAAVVVLSVYKDTKFEYQPRRQLSSATSPTGLVPPATDVRNSAAAPRKD